MSFEKVVDLSADKTIEMKETGATATGHYLGFRNVDSDYGVSKLHIFSTPEGTVGVFGSSKLDSSLSAVTPGTMTRVTFQGKKKLSNGRSMKLFNVEQDKSNRIDVSTVSNANAATMADDEDEAPATSTDNVSKLLASR